MTTPPPRLGPTAVRPRPPMSRRLHIVDVFAEERYAGNPLAVVLDADGLDETTMQLIAAETNYSETTFVESAPRSDGGWRVRLFTPAREIAFAGHPILGTAWVVRHHAAGAPDRTVVVDLAVGPVPVAFEDDAAGGEIAWFVAPSIRAGEICERARMAAALGIRVDAIDEGTPVRRYSAGTAAMIVPMRDRDALERAKLDLDRYAPLAAQGFPPLVYLWCREPRDPRNDVVARFFFEAHGVREDPATGNGAAFLGHYLLDHGLAPPTGFAWRIEQGREVRRPSVVRLRAREGDRGRVVEVGGRVVPTVRGELV